MRSERGALERRRRCSWRGGLSFLRAVREKRSAAAISLHLQNIIKTITFLVLYFFLLFFIFYFPRPFSGAERRIGTPLRCFAGESQITCKASPLLSTLPRRAPLHPAGSGIPDHCNIPIPDRDPAPEHPPFPPSNTFPGPLRAGMTAMALHALPLLRR